jgi:energy-converting hydrogenase Eha subunit B
MRFVVISAVIALAGCNTVVIDQSTTLPDAAGLIEADALDRDRLLQQGLIDTNRRLDNLMRRDVRARPAIRAPLVILPK